MRNLLLLTFLLWGWAAFAQQIPQRINYQAIARDAQGNPIANQAISVRLTILDNSATGNPIYKEEHSPATNAFGLFVIQIGAGTVLQGNFSTIDWLTNTKFLRTEMDMAGGTNYTIIGTTEFNSVSYALAADHVLNDKDAQILSYDPLIGILTISGGNTVNLPLTIDTDDQNLTLNGNLLEIDNGTSVNLSPYLDNTDAQSLSLSGNNLAISGGNSIVLSPEVDGSISNELQTISISGSIISLSQNGGSFTLPPEVDGNITNELQNISLTNNTLSLSQNGGSVSLSAYLDNTDNQDLVLTNNTLSLTNDATTVNLAPYLDNTDNQTLSYNTNTGALSILGGNSVTIPNGGGATYTAGTGIGIANNVISAQNSMAIWNAEKLQGNLIATTTPTNGQVLKWNSTNSVWTPSTDDNTTYTASTGISISGSTISNTSLNTDAQTLSLSGSTLSISGGNSVTLPLGTTYTAGTGISISGGVITNSGDVSNTNEIQTLSLSGSTLTLSNGGGNVSLPSSGIVILNSLNYQATTITASDIVEIVGTITLSADYTGFQYNDKIIVTGGGFVGSGAETILNIGSYVTFRGVSFQDVSITGGGVGLVFENCYFTGNCNNMGSTNGSSFIGCYFNGVTTSSTLKSIVSSRIESNSSIYAAFIANSDINQSIINAGQLITNCRVNGSTIYYTTNDCSFTNNVCSNTYITNDINTSGTAFSLTITGNKFENLLSGKSSIINFDMGNGWYKYWNISENIFSLQPSDPYSIVLSNGNTSYQLVKIQNNIFNRGQNGAIQLNNMVSTNILITNNMTCSTPIGVSSAGTVVEANNYAF